MERSNESVCLIMSHSFSRRVVINVVILVAALCAAAYSVSLLWRSGAPAAANTGPQVQIINGPQLKELLVAKRDEITLIDIRERHEFRNEHIPSAINIPFDEVEVRAEDELSKSSHIILYYFKCGDENTISAIASSSLTNLGFRNVTVLDGGIDTWKEISQDLRKEP